MSRYSYDDMPPEGYRERSKGRSSSLVIAFIGVLITLIAILLYLMFTPHEAESESTPAKAVHVTADVPAVKMLETESVESHYSEPEPALAAEEPLPVEAVAEEETESASLAEEELPAAPPSPAEMEIPAEEEPVLAEKPFASPLPDGELLYGMGDIYQNAIIEGVVIAADATSIVYAANDGMIIDFLPNERYGRGLVIQDSDDSYITVYRGIEEFFIRSVGTAVRKGDPIGTIGTSQVYFGRPALYFQIQQNGQAADPAELADI